MRHIGFTRNAVNSVQGFSINGNNDAFATRARSAPLRPSSGQSSQFFVVVVIIIIIIIVADWNPTAIIVDEEEHTSSRRRGQRGKANSHVCREQLAKPSRGHHPLSLLRCTTKLGRECVYMQKPPTVYFRNIATDQRSFVLSGRTNYPARRTGVNSRA